MADTINVTPEQPQEDPSYVQAMIDKAEGNQSQEGGEETLLAGKYKSQDDLLKGISELLKRQDTGSLEQLYKQLESGLGRQGSEQSSLAQEPASNNQGKEDQPQEGPASLQIQQQQAQTLLEQAGLNLEDFNREFAEHGRLSEESYDKLTKAGFPRQMVDAYIAGLQALAERQAQQLYEITGGEEGYRAMIEWASVNLSEADRQWFNQMVMTDRAPLAVEALWSRYTRVNGSPPKTLLQGGTSVSNSDVYESYAQLTQDMNDPRYKKDPAFRRKVEEKLMRSNLL